MVAKKVIFSIDDNYNIIATYCQGNKTFDIKENDILYIKGFIKKNPEYYFRILFKHLLILILNYYLSSKSFLTSSRQSSSTTFFSLILEIAPVTL